MAVIYLNRHRKLTDEQKKLAETVLSNEINEVMANLEIMEEELGRTFLFGDLSLRKAAIDYMRDRLKKKPDGSVDEEVLRKVYNHYFED